MACFLRYASQGLIALLFYFTQELVNEIILGEDTTSTTLDMALDHVTTGNEAVEKSTDEFRVMTAESSITYVFSLPFLKGNDIFSGGHHIVLNEQGFPSGLLNKGPRDSQCGVKRSLIMIQGFVVLKRLKLLPKY